jgi:hypothetical protein
MRNSFVKIFVCVVIVALASTGFGQTTQDALPNDPGMYVDTAGGPTKIIGQIAEFRRSGSALVSHATVGIKSQKENIQLLGPHAQNIVSSQPIFYFIPAKQEADTGVNAGDLILIRLEEKPERRQFEIAARGAWRSSAGISLTHQVQLLRSEAKPGVYKIAPASTLSIGEYALYLSRGEGMAAYVYDFGVQQNAAVASEQGSSPRNQSTPETHPGPDTSLKPRTDSATPQFSTARQLAFADGNPYIRHDGVTLTAVTAGGPADQVGIRAGDVILAIADHYLFTIAELREEISHQQLRSKVAIRYRRYSTINDTFLVVGEVQ